MNLTELKKLAESATPGPWEIRKANVQLARGDANMNQTPVAWIDHYTGELKPERVNFKEHPLYSLEQLRQARADALREAAEVFVGAKFMVLEPDKLLTAEEAVIEKKELLASVDRKLRRMADEELKGEKG